MLSLIARLKADFPELVFTVGNTFYWSPEIKQVIYTDKPSYKPVDKWSLLHEASHALLSHYTYHSDFELLLMESEAWHKAEQLAKRYKLEIDSEHIQDCLDTYRDWLHRRSSCPTCGNQSLQSSPVLYGCFNCGTQWRVSEARFCRPYRLRVAAPRNSG